jgi:hypothetical protein
MGFAADLARQAFALALAGGLAAGLSVAAEAQGSAQGKGACADPEKAGAMMGGRDFVQTRHLSGLAAPLVSHGHVVVSRDRVDWNVEDPLSIHTAITAKGITQSVDGGPYEPLGSASQQAWISGAGLFDLLVGNFEGVKAVFKIETIASGSDGWKLRLTPLAQGFASVVSEIDVSGCKAIDGVEVHQTGGDVMEIELSPPASGG